MTETTHVHRMEGTARPYVDYCHCGQWFIGTVAAPTRDAEGEYVFGPVLWVPVSQPPLPTPSAA